MIGRLLICFAWVLGVAGNTVAAAQLTLTLAHGAPLDNPRHKAAQFFAETVKQRSKGHIVVEVAGAASLGDDVAMVEALLNGSLDMSANSQGPVSAVVPEYNAYGMPFLFSRASQAWSVLDGPLGRQLAQRSAQKGLIVLGYWDNGIRQISNNVRPLVSPDDLNGLRLRAPPDPVAVDILEALGAQVRQIKWSDVFNALQLGVVDGQENPLVNIYAGKLYEVQKFISLTGHKYEMTPFLMSKRTWDKLSAQDRATIMQAAAEATQFQRQLMTEAESEAYLELLKQGVRINKIDQAPFVLATRKVYDKWKKEPIGEYVRSVILAAQAVSR